MYYVGIDVAKQTHYAAVMNSDGEILVSPFHFSNNHVGFQLLLDNLSEFPKEQVLIGMEFTAHYAENALTNALLARYPNTTIPFPINAISSPVIAIPAITTASQVGSTYLIGLFLQYTYLFISKGLSISPSSMS